MASIYCKRIVYLYTPDTQTTNRAPAYFTDYTHFLLNFNPDSVAWRDEIAAVHPTGQMWIYFQSHGVKDFDFDYDKAPGTPAPLATRPLNNNAFFNYGDVKRMRDNEFPGYGDSVDWVLLDSNGDHFYGDEGNTLVLDPGNTGWQQFFTEVMIGLTESQAWSAGVFLDNTNAYSGTFTALRKDTQVYGNYKSQAWITTMAAFCALLTQACHNIGKLCGGNVQAENYDDFTQIAITLDYVMIEFFAFNSSGGYRDEATWLEDIQKAEFLGANGIGAWLISHLDSSAIAAGNSTELTKLTFHLASVLLIMAPKTSYRGHGDYGQARYFSQYTTIDNLGGPISGRYEVTPGVWRRDFQNGFVQVNPAAQIATITYTNAGTYTPATYAPLVANMLDRVDTVGDEVSQALYAESLDDGTLSFSATGLPPGISIDSQTGLLRGRLTTGGLTFKYSPVITITNSNGAGSVSATTRFTWWVKPGTVLARVNCGGSAQTAIDNGQNWVIDQNSTSTYRNPLGDNSNSSSGSITRGLTVPVWWPDSVLEAYRFNANGDTTYVIPVGTAQPVVVNLGFRASSARQYDVLIQGAKVLSAFDPVAEYGASGTGVKSFTATPDANQDVSVTISAGGNASPNTPQIAGVEITRFPQTVIPSIAAIEDPIAINGQSISIPISVTDWNGNGTTLTATNLPPGLVIVDNNSIQGTLSPTADSNSPYTVTLTATDDADNNLMTNVQFTFTVLVAIPPKITPVATQISAVGDAVSLPMQASSPDNGTRTYAANGLPKGLSISPTTGLISGEILADSATLKYTPTITVSNNNGAGVAISTMTFTWWVKPGTAIVRVNCGANEVDATDGGINWSDDGNTTGLYRIPLGDNSDRELAGTYRGEDAPLWWPIDVLGRWRFTDDTAGVTYVLPVGTSDDVLVNIGLRGSADGTFDVLIQGQTLLSEIDTIMAYRAGGTGIRSFIATPDAQQNITVTLNPSPNTAQIAGIEVMTITESGTDGSSSTGNNVNHLIRLITQRRTRRYRR